MKYLYIELEIRQSEFEHMHRVLHTTNANNIQFAAQRYAATFWGESERLKYGDKKEDIWEAHGGEMHIKVYRVKELTQKEYNTMYNILYYGNNPKTETRVYVVNIDEFDMDTEVARPGAEDFDEELFIERAEEEGRVYTLSGFQEAFNNEQISDVCDYILIVT